MNTPTNNKIPSENSIIDLKLAHNNFIDNLNRIGYENLIINGDFTMTIESEDGTTPPPPPPQET